MAELENTNTEVVTGENTTEVSEVKTEETKEEKLFTQADLDAAIEKRLQRERKKAEKEAAKAEEEAKAKDDSEEIRTLKEIIKAKDQRIIKQEAAKTASEIGVDSDFVEAVIALANFSDINLDNNGEVDADELKEALKSVIDKYPKFLAKKEETKEDTGFIKAGTPSQTNNLKVDDSILRGAFRLNK